MFTDAECDYNNVIISVYKIYFKIMSVFVLGQWIVVLGVALYALYKGTDIVLLGIKNVVKTHNVQSHYYGAVLMGMAAALPVLALSLAGVYIGHTSVVLPTVLGSVITILLLIGGVIACVGGSIVLWEDFLKTSLPVFCLSIVLFVIVIRDGMVDRLESVLLFSIFCIFVGYIYSVIKFGEVQPIQNRASKSISLSSLVYIVFGIVAILVGAKFSVDMSVNLATALSVSMPLVGISVLALGAILPTFILVLQALQRKDVTFALGIIIGSSICSVLLASSMAGLWAGNLAVGEVVTQLGVPVLICAAIIIFVSSLSRNFTRPVGLMMLTIFLFFLLNLAKFIG